MHVMSLKKLGRYVAIAAIQGVLGILHGDASVMTPVLGEARPASVV